MKLNFSEKQADFITSPFENTFEVLEGTPRSGKTTAGHFRYARYLLETEDANHLIVAYSQEQAYRLFIDGDGTGIKHIFGHLCEERDDKHGAHLVIYTPKGIRRVYYKGGSKVNSVGAITGMSLGSVVFGEINLLHMDMIQECFRRTFAAKNRFHMADLNPPAPHHPVITNVFEVQDTKWTHWTINDNPILTEERKLEIYNVLKKSNYLLQRDWYGERVMPQGVIYSMFDINEHILNSIEGKVMEMYFTADGGQSDATTCHCNLVVLDKGKYKLLQVASYYHSGKDTGQIKAMSIYAKELKAFVEWCTNKYQRNHSEFMVDPACKSLREELHIIGIQTKGAMNNSGEVSSQVKGIEVGIERLQNAISKGMFFLVENDTYHHKGFLTELGMYVRLDNGNPIDNYNHALDNTRYAINYFYKHYIN